MNNYTRKQIVIFSLGFLVLGVVLGIALHSHGSTKTALGRALPFLDPGANPMLQDIRSNIPRAEIVNVNSSQIEVKDSAGLQSKFNISANAQATDIRDINKPVQLKLDQLKSGDIVSLQLQQQGFQFEVIYIVLSPPTPKAQ